MAQRFYVFGSHAVDQQLFLNAERSNYLCRVLRLVRGDQVEIFDGTGNVFACEIVADNPRQTELRVLTQNITARPRNSKLGVAIGLIKGQPMDRAIAQATELGATDIYLLEGQRSNVKLNKQRMFGKLEHWHKVIVASCEQCGQINLPTLHNPSQLTPMLAQLSQSNSHLIFFDPQANPAPNQLDPKDRVIFIGPEGGFSPEELRAFADYQAEGYRLGTLILRAETMPAAALTLIHQAAGWPTNADD